MAASVVCWDRLGRQAHESCAGDIMQRSSEKPEHPNCSIIAPRDVSRCLSPQIGSGGKRGAFYMYGVRNECAPMVSLGVSA